VATLEAPEASPSSPTLEGEATLKTFLAKQRQWLMTRVVTPTHLHQIFLNTKSRSCRREAVTELFQRLPTMAHISDIASRARDYTVGGDRWRPRGHLFIIVDLLRCHLLRAHIAGTRHLLRRPFPIAHTDGALGNTGDIVVHDGQRR
jgi:hypothetical protein